MENVLSLIFFVLSMVLMVVVNILVYFERNDEVLGICTILNFAVVLAATILHSTSIGGFDIATGIGIGCNIAAIAAIITSYNAALNYDANKDPYLVTVTAFYILTFIEICLVAVSLAQ